MQGKHITWLVLCVAALATAEVAAAECLALTTVAETEIQSLDEQGRRITRLVPATKVVPGDQVIWTITARNTCGEAATGVRIDNPVPAHVTYLADSATGPGAEIAFSLDGRSYAVPAALYVQEPDGARRRARPEEYTHIRWTFRTAIAPGTLAIARFRAIVK